MADKKEVRKFKRYDEEVNLSEYLKFVDDGFDLFLAGTGWNDEQKQYAREVYNEYTNDIDNGTITEYGRNEKGRGFLSPKTYKNNEKFPKIREYVAGFLGNAMRKMSAYVEPEEEPDPNKFKYNNEGITNAIKGKLDQNSYFSKLSDKEKFQIFNEIISDVRTNPTNYFSDWDETKHKSELNTFLSRYDTWYNTAKANEILDNNREIYDLEDIFHFGPDYLGGLFFPEASTTGTSTTDSTATTTETPTTGAGSYLDVTQEDLNNSLYAAWLEGDGKISDYTGPSLYDRSSLRLTGSDNRENDIKALKKQLNNLQTSDLVSLLKTAITNSENISQHFKSLGINLTGIRGLNRSEVRFTILSSLKDKQDFIKNHSLGNDGSFWTSFYDPNKNYGIVWNNTKKTLEYVPITNLRSIKSIDAQVQSRFNTWKSKQKYQKGGVIRKFYTGGSTNPMEKVFRIINENEYTPYIIDDNVFKQNLYQDDGTFTQIVRNNNFKVSPSEYDKKKYKKEKGGKELQDQDYYKKFHELLNSDEYLAQKFAEYLIPKLGDTYKENIYNWFDKDNKFNYDQFKKTLKAWDFLNGPQHDSLIKEFFDNDRAYTYYYDDNGKTVYFNYDEIEPNNFEIEDQDWQDYNGLFFRKKLKLKSSENPQTSTEDPSPEDGKKDDQTPQPKDQLSTTGQQVTPYRKNLDKLWPNLLEAASFALNQYGNRKERDAAKAYRPWIKDTYELHRPIVGDWGARNHYERQAANTLNMAMKGMTSDASLNAAIASEAFKKATDLRTQGFIADNKRIAETMAESMKLGWGNTERRSETANFNRKQIADYNREMATLQANYYNKQYNSAVNYLQKMGLDWRIKEEKERNYMAFQEQLSADRANTWYNNKYKEVSDILRTEFDTEEKKKENKERYNQLIAYSRYLDSIKNHMLYRDYAILHNQPYSAPNPRWRDEYFDKLSFTSWKPNE